MNIVFADLVHTGHACSAVPYGIATVAAYALHATGGEFSAFLTRTVAEISDCFEHAPPGVACFASYLWNEELSLAVARRIKERFPACVTVFGGPNYPLDACEQKSYLENHPQIDFFIFREGEGAFLGLYSTLKAYAFDTAALKGRGVSIPGCHYIHGADFVAGEAVPAVSLDGMPSPYLTGLCDRFLLEGYVPIIQTTRGCPFVCAYCQEGADYYNPIRRYDPARTKMELRHIAARAVSRKLFIADSNFGMYPEDLAVADEIARIQDQFAWPDFVDCISGKNNKSLVLQTAGKIRGGQFSAAIQSSDGTVLNNIRRRNVSIEEMIETASEIDLYETHSFSEIILALPGDTAAAHMRSAGDLMDAGIHVVRSHQFIMLPGAELSSAENRRKYGLETRFRVIPNTSGAHQLFGQSFAAPEIDEICVAGNTMTFEEYLDCRCFDLSVEILYNNGMFYELQQFLKQQGVSISSYILHVHRRARSAPSLAWLYEQYLVDARELWKTRDAVHAFLRIPGVMERYRVGELGRNEQLAYKAVAIFEKMSEMVEICYDAARDMLSSAGRLQGDVSHYVSELMQFDLYRKVDPLDLESRYTGSFGYDFIELMKNKFAVNPFEYKSKSKIDIEFAHSELYRNYMRSMHEKLSSGIQGYAAVISTNPKIRDYFREASQV